MTWVILVTKFESFLIVKFVGYRTFCESRRTNVVGNIAEKVMVEVRSSSRVVVQCRCVCVRV